MVNNSQGTILAERQKEPPKVVELTPADIKCAEARKAFKEGSYYLALRTWKTAKRLGSIKAVEDLADVYAPGSSMPNGVLRKRLKPIKKSERYFISDCLRARAQRMKKKATLTLG